MVQMLWLGGVALAALATVIWPRWPLALLRLRALGQWGESDEEPDRREFRTWPIRAVAATVLAVVVAISVDAWWPADHALKRLAGVGAFLVLSIALAIWFLAALVAHRDAASRARLEAIAEGDTGVARRAGSGFAFDFLAVAVLLVTVATTGAALANLLDPERNANAGQTPTATPTETQNLVDETLSDFNDLHPQYEHLDVMPENSLAIGPWWYNVVDAANQEPYNVWHRSKPLFGGDVDTYLNNADLVLSTPGFGCDVIGMMVVETETTVAIAIVVVDPTPDATAPPTATPNPAAPSPEASPTPTPTPTGLDFRCAGGNGVFRDWFPVDLATPLGDRTVQTLDGRRISEAR